MNYNFTPMVSVSNQNLMTFSQAFDRLHPRVTRRGSTLVLTNRGEEYRVPMTIPQVSVGQNR